MKVTTVRLPDDLAEAVEEAATNTERSQSEYIRHVLRSHIDSEPNTGTDDEHLDRIERRLNDHEERLDDLEDAGGVDAWRGLGGGPEAAVDEDTDADAGGGGPDRDEAAEAVRKAVWEAIGDGPPRKTHAREALVDAVAVLAERGALETGELKAELYPRYEAEYSTQRTMWNSLDRHLGELPGVHKPEYGTWAVDVKALVEG